MIAGTVCHRCGSFNYGAHVCPQGTPTATVKYAWQTCVGELWRGHQVITKDDLEDAIGSPRETSVKLDWTLQCYGQMEKRNAEIRRENMRLREALTHIAEHDPSGGPDYTPNIIARDALASPRKDVDHG